MWFGTLTPWIQSCPHFSNPDFPFDRNIAVIRELRTVKFVRHFTSRVLSPTGMEILPTCTIVSRKYAPPFAILALVQNAAAYMRDATISLAIMPSLPVKHDIVCGQVRGREMLLTLAVG